MYFSEMLMPADTRKPMSEYIEKYNVINKLYIK